MSIGGENPQVVARRMSRESVEPCIRDGLWDADAVRRFEGALQLGIPSEWDDEKVLAHEVGEKVRAAIDDGTVSFHDLIDALQAAHDLPMYERRTVRNEAIELKYKFNRLLREAMRGRRGGPKWQRRKIFQEVKAGVLKELGVFDESERVVEGKEDVWRAFTEL